jgi:PKD-like domain/GEVED domain/Secretion system C-terminal sorting domain
MKKQLLRISALLGLAYMGFANIANAQSTKTDSLNFTGSMQTYTVPCGVTSITINAYGAQGGDGAVGGNSVQGGVGALGGYSSGTLAVTPGQVLNIFVGGAGTIPAGGFNGGGNGGAQNAGGGGGATDVRIGGTAESNRILTAGGGGGGGRGGCHEGSASGGIGGNGGTGGGGVGQMGNNSAQSNGVAGGGNGGNFGSIQGAFGPAGIGCPGFLGQPGATAATGNGAIGGGGQSCCCSSGPAIPGGGGGGGGQIGGGGGGGGSAGTVGCAGNSKGAGGGGGGGSSYNAGMTLVGTLTQGLRSGNGVVIITYNDPNPSIPAAVIGSIAICANASGTYSVATQANATSYIWTVTGGLSIVSGQGNDTVVISNNGTSGNITVSASNACNTSAASTPVSITINALPVVTATAPAAICSGSNTSLNAFLSSGTFCQPTYSTGTGFGDYISKVQLNTLLVNSLGAASPYYTLFPDTGSATTTLVAGVTDTIRFRAGTYTENDFAAWIDYNQNNIFETSEKLGQVLNLDSIPTEGKIGFTVPVTAFNGKTRMRVRELDGATNIVIDPCTVQSQYGEVEDYTITITGGVTNITYAWSPATFLSSTSVSNPTVTAATTTTNYIVTATSSAGCVDTASVAVTVNALPNVTANASSAGVCAGGTVTLSGGGAASYTWNNSVTNGVSFVPASTNTYIVTGTDANTCSDTSTVTVSVNALPTVTASATSLAVCAGGTLTLSGGGASTYTWNNGISNGILFIPASSNTYIVTGTDANTCSDTASITIPVNALPIVTASATASAICAGQSTTLTGGGAVSYVWDNGATNGVAISPSGTTTYTVTGTDANTCSNTATQTITVNANPVSSLTAPVSSLCAGTPVTLTGLPAGGVYSVVSGSASALVGNVFNAATVGPYTIAYTSTNGAGCSDSAQFNFNVNCILSIDALSKTSTTINIFPNPNSGQFTINSSTEINGTVELFNELGQTVYKENMNGVSKQIQLQNVSVGIYHLKIVNGQKLLSGTLNIIK